MRFCSDNGSVVNGTLQATGALPPHPINEHFPELASWMIVLAFFTRSGVCFIVVTGYDFRKLLTS
jgi:hypothetical protein